MPNDALMSLPEAAQHLGVSRHTLRGWIRQKRIAYVRLGRRVLFAPADVQKFVTAHRVEAVPVREVRRGA
jgi:excisionase family DNA binding protein